MKSKLTVIYFLIPGSLDLDQLILNQRNCFGTPLNIVSLYRLLTTARNPLLLERREIEIEIFKYL